MYGKKNKKKNKNYSRNNVILSLWSRSVGIYNFRVDKMFETQSEHRMRIVSKWLEHRRRLEHGFELPKSALRKWFGHYLDGKK